ncbi:MAG: hypothetical protein PHW18_01340 [Sulfuricurvum sp.]|nr:hypothetical protein [Sulfuricurvum sp.]
MSKNHPITILTSTMNHLSLKKILLKNTTKGYPLTLITSTPKNDPASLIAYKNVELTLYDKRKLEGTSILIDTLYGCQLSTSLDEEILLNTTQIVFCSDEPAFISTMDKEFQTLQKRSHSYLK